LDLIDLRGSEKKYPAQLSGGQQQRVALARALAPSPRLLLLDEPLSALDAKVRVHLRQQIRSLQKRLGLTTIMVTHDQEEALSMGDRIVAMNGGEIEQIGTPMEIYRSPSSLFVANFVGKMNVLPGRVAGKHLSIGSLEMAVPERYDTPEIQDQVVACIRPEQVRLGREGDASGLAATVTSLEFLGSFWRVMLVVPDLGGAELAVDRTGADMALVPVQVGQSVQVIFPSQEFGVFPAAGSQRQPTEAAVQ
jgi:iron(III) transport system ATP-binding protein